MNRGYEGNRETCDRNALETDAEVVVMPHPDNQYDGALVLHMIGFIEAGVVDIVPVHHGLETDNLPLGRITRYALETLAVLGPCLLYRAGWRSREPLQLAARGLGNRG